MAQYSKLTNDYLAQQTTIHEVVMIADKSGRIINEFGGAVANISVASGLLQGYDHTHKFGAVPEMSNGQTGTVWDKNDTLYPWSAWDTHGVVTLTTHAANDTLSTDDSGGSVTIYGLDTNFEEQEETIAISGSAGTGALTFSRVWRAYFTPASGSAGNATRIKMFRGATEVVRINIDKAQTLMAVYTVPAGKTAFMCRKSSTVQGSGYATVEMYIRYGGENAFRVQNTAQVNGPGGQYIAEFIIPLKYPEKTDIDFRASGVSNNARITASFDILMIDNTLLV